MDVIGYGRFPTITSRELTSRTAVSPPPQNATSHPERPFLHHHKTQTYRQNGRFPTTTSRNFTHRTAVSPPPQNANLQTEQPALVKTGGRFPTTTKREFTRRTVVLINCE
ncbi:MAG: hypothetical protein GY805_37290 [Chloroflexi bacterium]|nr:hypothetical protein [Chloroflexota bacterium]